MITPRDYHIIEKVLDDIRKEFPIKEALDYEDKIAQIIHNKIWDILSNLQTKYEREADFVLREMAVRLDKDNFTDKDLHPNHPEDI